jgi:aspartate aminotransferase-like enzyme
MTFRIGLFGLEKLHNIDRSIGHLSSALDKLGLKEKVPLAA